MTASANVAEIQPGKEKKAVKASLVTKMAETYGVDPGKFYDALSSVAFRQSNNVPPTREEMLALLVVADQYGLNPFTREIYAFKDKAGRIIPVVGFDGWIRLVNQHPQFDGVRFENSPEMIKVDNDAKMCFEYITCIMTRKDRKEPIAVTEYLDEVYRPKINMGSYMLATPHQSHTKRMLRTKSYIQAARIAFGFVGIYDPDEAQGMIDVTAEGQTLDDASHNLPSATAGNDVAGGVKDDALSGDTPRLADQTAVLDYGLLDNLSSELISKAKAAEQWDVAHKFAEMQFKGHALNYVKNKLTMAETEHEQQIAKNVPVAEEPEYEHDQEASHSGKFVYDVEPQQGMMYPEQSVSQ